MKNLILLTISLLISFHAIGQKSETETRKVESFKKISVNSVIQVELYKGDSGEIEIYTENVPTEMILSEVKNGNLSLDLKERKTGWNDVEIKVRVPIKNLSHISGNVASTISSDETLKFEELTISLNAASQCDLNIECNLLNVHLNAASKLVVKGTCKKLDAHVNAAAVLKAFKMELIDADITANSMARVKINVKSDLHVTASSMAKVSYMGEPSKIYENISSTATLKKVNGNLKSMK